MRINIDTLPQLTINGIAIRFIKLTKNLGMKLAEDLSWNSHISAICSRVHGVPNHLRFRTYYLSSSLKKQLVTAFILPHFDYPFIFRLPRDALLAPYIAKLVWFTPEKRRKYFLAVILYQILTIAKPPYLTAFFAP
ncbi:hypothetical protein TSAR_007687 [Trichomalopsis sarcophagae]|uniref:Uncharacterized protein n=1 Tax=Trichomalopsis sarcophagae TaxID=543379 RepID=A0A232EHV4_9HYME|nr:hypothetical protein TSAR_007687 [Trichomalopsis sarcophagae]